MRTWVTRPRIFSEGGQVYRFNSSPRTLPFQASNQVSWGPTHKPGPSKSSNLPTNKPTPKPSPQHNLPKKEKRGLVRKKVPLHWAEGRREKMKSRLMQPQVESKMGPLTWDPGELSVATTPETPAVWSFWKGVSLFGNFPSHNQFIPQFCQSWCLTPQGCE